MRALSPRTVLIGVIGVYQATLSPVFGLVSRCRHMPSCSAFACDAIGAHGAWAGGWMALARICRCRPGGSWGYDPAPSEKPAAHWFAPWTYGDWQGGYRPPPDDAKDKAA
jgi:putative membrane protein insertion efficiency factor